MPDTRPDHRARTDKEPTLWGVDVTGSAGQKAKRYIREIPGTAGTENLRRLKALFQENPGPSPVEIYRAYHGEVSLGGAGSSTTSPVTGDGFDPAEDRARSSDKIRVERAYEAAVANGWDEAAEFLRAADLTHQRGLTSLLFGAFIDEGGA